MRKFGRDLTEPFTVRFTTLEDARVNVESMEHYMEQLEAENAALRELCKEANDYLNTNHMTSIGHGSILHRKFQDAQLSGDA